MKQQQSLQTTPRSGKKKRRGHMNWQQSKWSCTESLWSSFFSEVKGDPQKVRKGEVNRVLFVKEAQETMVQSCTLRSIFTACSSISRDQGLEQNCFLTENTPILKKALFFSFSLLYFFSLPSSTVSFIAVTLLFFYTIKQNQQTNKNQLK